MAWRIPMVDLVADYRDAGAAVEEGVLRVLRSGRYVLGPETARLETELARWIGTRFAVGVGSGTDALTLALRAAGVGPGDEVVTSAFTHFATVEAIRLAGADPVFVDIERGGFHLGPERLDAAIGPRTRAVLPVHLFGRCADVARVLEVSDAREIPVIEDAAQSLGAARQGRRAGSWGLAGCFSFYPSKVLGGVGDGGCITTDDPELAQRVRLLRSHGSSRGDVHELIGAASRLDAIQAAALWAKLPHLKAWVEGRVRNARIYADELADVDGLVLPVADSGEDATWSQYTIRCRRAPEVRTALRAAGIEYRRYYSLPAYRQPALGDNLLPWGSYPEADRACTEAISIPIRSSCSPSAIREVAGVIRRALEA